MIRVSFVWRHSRLRFTIILPLFLGSHRWEFCPGNLPSKESYIHYVRPSPKSTSKKIWKQLQIGKVGVEELTKNSSFFKQPDWVVRNTDQPSTKITLAVMSLSYQSPNHSDCKKVTYCSRVWDCPSSRDPWLKHLCLASLKNLKNWTLSSCKIMPETISHWLS